MEQRRIGERQRWAWLAAGLSAVAAAKLCGMGWLGVLTGGAAVTGYYIYMDHRLPEEGAAALLTKLWGKTGRVLQVLTLGWSLVVLAWTAGLAASAFPMAEGFPILGLVLLAAAAWGCVKGAAACARCAGVLCLFLAALYGTVAAFALPDVELRFLIPQQPWENALAAAGLFLLPSALWFLPCRRSRPAAAKKLPLVLPAAAGLLAAVTDGVLSWQLAQSKAAPLYAAAQSVSIFGVLERIEPLVSAAMTMGVFCLLSAQLCACGELAGSRKQWKGWPAAAAAVAGAGMWPAAQLPAAVIGGGTAVFYLLIPAAAAAWAARKGRFGETS